MTADNIANLMQEQRLFEPPIEGRERAHIKSLDEYRAIYKRSIEDPDGYWGERATELLSWFKPWDKVLEYDFEKPEIKWFAGGQLNAAYNCLDRHLTDGRRNKAALIWQGEDDKDVRTYTYQMLHDEVCRFANVLKKMGVQKGDRVSLYLPMVPELAIAMLACARIGAPHSIIFAGFSSHSLRDRINDCGAKVLVTSDAVIRSGKTIPLKPNSDDALKECACVEKCIVLRHAGNEVEMLPGRDLWWHDVMADHDVEGDCPPEPMDAEDVLFILYTSGSTGKPKGVYHTTGGYLTYAAHTSQIVFDLHARLFLNRAKRRPVHQLHGRHRTAPKRHCSPAGRIDGRIKHQRRGLKRMLNHRAIGDFPYEGERPLRPDDQMQQDGNGIFKIQKGVQAVTRGIFNFELATDACGKSRVGQNLGANGGQLRQKRIMETVVLPPDLDYAVVSGLSREVVEKLTRVAPRTLGQAGRISGVTPAALACLEIHLKKQRS